MSYSETIAKEYKDYKNKVDSVNEKIVASNKVEVVLSSQKIESQILELEQKAIPVFKNDPSIFKYSSDKLCADYQTFILKPFSVRLKFNDRLSRILI